MAYDEYLADRIRQTRRSKRFTAEEKKVMPGLLSRPAGRNPAGIPYPILFNFPMITRIFVSQTAGHAIPDRGKLPEGHL